MRTAASFVEVDEAVGDPRVRTTGIRLATAIDNESERD